MADLYIALLRPDGTEPPPETGYRRAKVGVCDLVSAKDIFNGRDIVFPDVKPPGYGVIDAMAVFDRETGGNFIADYTFPNAWDCYAGVVPVIHNGQLYRGVEVQAKVNMNSADLIRGV